MQQKKIRKTETRQLVHKVKDRPKKTRFPAVKEKMEELVSSSGMTLQEISKATYIPEEELQSLMIGWKRPDLSEIISIDKKLGVDLMCLINSPMKLDRPQETTVQERYDNLTKEGEKAVLALINALEGTP